MSKLLRRHSWHEVKTDLPGSRAVCLVPGCNAERFDIDWEKFKKQEIKMRQKPRQCRVRKTLPDERRPLDRWYVWYPLKVLLYVWAGLLWLVGEWE